MVNGHPATVTGTTFAGSATVSPGANKITATASNANGTTSHAYQTNNQHDRSGDTPFLSDFENSLSESAIGLGAYLATQTAHLIDMAGSSVANAFGGNEQPDNFGNYWGMAEVYRHQRLIDAIKGQMRKQGCP